MADQEILSISIDPGDSAAKALELKKQLEALAKESEDLAKSFKAGAVGLDEHIGRQDALAKKVAATTAAYEKQVATIQKAATQTASINTSMGGAVPSSAPGGNKGINTALLQGGRMAQDLTQGGFGSIANNLIEIAPLLGVAALGIDLLNRNGEKFADTLHGWADAIRGSNAELADLATAGEGFFRNFGFEAAGNWYGAFASNLGEKFNDPAFMKMFLANPGAALLIGGGLGSVNPGEYARRKLEAREAAEGREDLKAILGDDDKARKASLVKTIEEAGGGYKFGAQLFNGLGKEGRDSMARRLREALGTGDENAFLAIQGQLKANGRADLAAALDANRPPSKSDEENYRYEEDRFEKSQKAHEQAKRQAKEDLKAANDRARDTNEQLDREEREAKQKMQGKARDTLDEMDGLKGNASLTYARYLANGASPDSASRDIAESIQRELEARGIDSDTAREQAGDYARGVRRDVGNRIVAAGMSAEREILNKPAVFGLADANRLAQEAGPKIQEEQRDLLKLTVEHLAGIRSSGFPAVVGP